MFLCTILKHFQIVTSGLFVSFITLSTDDQQRVDHMQKWKTWKPDNEALCVLPKENGNGSIRDVSAHVCHQRLDFTIKINTAGPYIKTPNVQTLQHWICMNQNLRPKRLRFSYAEESFAYGEKVCFGTQLISTRIRYVIESFRHFRNIYWIRVRGAAMLTLRSLYLKMWK